MKSSALFILCATVVTGYAEVAIVPERFPVDRYAKLKSDPPFGIKTDDGPPPEAKIDWAESLYLSGASKDVVNGEEKDWVYIGHKSDPSAGFQLYGKDPGKDQIQIVKLDWHPENPARTEVHLKKGTEFAIIKRDQAAFTAPPVPQQPGAPRPGQPMIRPPGQPAPGMTAIPNAAGAIRQPVVQPRAPVIPRPSGGVVPAPQNFPQPAAGAAQPQGQQGQQDRRRIRVINSPR